MPSGTCGTLAELPEAARAILVQARRAVLATLAPDGTPHAVPVVFALRGDEIVTPVDEKPKAQRAPARVRNIERDARATLLADHWDEDWTRLGWVMVRADARIEPLGSAAELLRARYPQYDGTALRDQLIVLRPARISWWTWT